MCFTTGISSRSGLLYCESYRLALSIEALRLFLCSSSEKWFLLDSSLSFALCIYQPNRRRAIQQIYHPFPQQFACFCLHSPIQRFLGSIDSQSVPKPPALFLLLPSALRGVRRGRSAALSSLPTRLLLQFFLSKRPFPLPSLRLQRASRRRHAAHARSDRLAPLAAVRKPCLAASGHSERRQHVLSLLCAAVSFLRRSAAPTASQSPLRALSSLRRSLLRVFSRLAANHQRLSKPALSRYAIWPQSCFCRCLPLRSLAIATRPLRAASITPRTLSVEPGRRSRSSRKAHRCAPRRASRYVSPQNRRFRLATNRLFPVFSIVPAGIRKIGEGGVDGAVSAGSIADHRGFFVFVTQCEHVRILRCLGFHHAAVHIPFSTDPRGTSPPIVCDFVPSDLCRRFPANRSKTAANRTISAPELFDEPIANAPLAGGFDARAGRVLCAARRVWTVIANQIAEL